MTLNLTLLLFILFVTSLALILLGLNALFAPHRSNEDKASTYECGVPVVNGQTRESFPVHFYIVAMLFLIFDIELVLLLPISVSLKAVNTYGFIIAIIFFIILTIGFIVELTSGAITILPNKKDNTTNTNTSLTPVALNPKSTNISIWSNLYSFILNFMNFDSMYCYSIFTNIVRFIIYIIIPSVITLFILYCSVCLFKYTGVFNEEELTNILDKMAKTHMT